MTVKSFSGQRYFGITCAVLLIFISLAGCVHQIAPASVALDKGGCIDKDLHTCIDTLQQTMIFPLPNQLTDELARYNQTDINGKHVGGDSIQLLTRLPSVAGNVGVVLKLSNTHNVKINGDLTVKSAEAILPDDPSMARTDDEFARTGLYEMSAILLGSECPNLTRDQIEKFFYNNVEPKLVREKEKVEFHDTGVETTYAEHASGFNFCGRKFSFYLLFGHNTDNITLENPHGVYRSPTISFE